MIFYIPVDMKGAMTNPLNFYFWKLVVVIFFATPFYILSGLCIWIDSIQLYPVIDRSRDCTERVEITAGEYSGHKGTYVDVRPQSFGIPTVWFIKLDTGEKVMVGDGEWTIYKKYE